MVNEECFEKQGNVFEEKSINQLIMLFSVPTICSLVLESLSAMIDTAFAGHLGAASGDALSAMGILSPVLQILIAAQLIFGVSTSIVISKRLGENNGEKINNTFKVGFYAALISSALISLGIFFFQNQLMVLIGAEGQVLKFAKEYLNIAVIFNVFSSVGYMLVNNIRVLGYPKIEIMVGVFSTIIHVIFNIIFTYGFDLGIKGIAIASLISEMFYFGFSMIFLIKKGLWIRKSIVTLKEGKNILISLVKIGFVQFLMQSLNSISAFVVNKVLIVYGSVYYVGAWSVCSSINSVVLLPLIGLTQGAQSIIAYFHGSGDKNRKKKAKYSTVKCSVTYSVVVTFIMVIFADKVLRIFTGDLNLLDLALPIIKIILIGFPLMGILYTVITFMQVSGEEKRASTMELIRQIVLQIPLSIVFPALCSRYSIMNISPQVSIFYSIPISTLLVLFIYGRKIRLILKN